MRNFSFLAVLFLLIVSSCTTTKVERSTQNDFRGDWMLNQIVNDSGDKVVVTKLLGQASLDCFEGSEWHLVANNNSGYYILDGANCPSGENQIKWYTQEDGSDVYFWFKRINDGEKAKDVTSGYKLKLVSVDENAAHLMHEVPYQGGKMALHYYFSKL